MHKFDGRIMASIALGVILTTSVFGFHNYSSNNMMPLASAATCTVMSHKPILITSDNDFTASNGVVSGSGAASNPYVIGTWKIDDLSSGYGIKIDNSNGKITKFFNIQCIQSSFTTTPALGEKLIWLVNIHNPTTISDVSSNAGEKTGSTGVVLDSSSNITLDNMSLNKFKVDGIAVNLSDHITIIGSKLKASHAGASIMNSHDVAIGKSCNLSSTNGGCNEFTYSGRGVYVLDSYNVNVQYTITSGDDTTGVLVDGPGTYNVKLTNGVTSGDGTICERGSPSGDAVDYESGVAIINGAHDISMSGYTLRGDSHYSMMNGGDGTFLNPCTNLVEKVPVSAPGGSNLSVNGNCYTKEFGFNPVPTSTC